LHDRSPPTWTAGNAKTSWLLLITALAAAAATRWWPVSTGASLLLLTWLPGRLVLARLGLLRQLPTGGAVLLAVAVSLALVPIPLDWLWRCTHNAWAMLGAWWVLLAGLTCLPRAPFRLQRHAEDTPEPQATDTARAPAALFEHRRTRWAAVLVGGWLACTITLTYWPTELLGYPLPAGPHDYIKHHAVLDSLQRRPLPLGNVFFAGPDQKVYYYHFFYLAPATLRLWSLAGGEAPATLAAVAASLLGGLDTIPVLAEAARGRFMVTLDAWADLPFRVHNFYTQMVWCPQHMLGLVIVLVGVALLSRWPHERWWIAMGPLLLASLIGSTVYLAAAVLPGVGAWALLRLWQARRDRATAGRLLGALALIAVLTAALALPQVLGYAEMARRYEGGLTMQWPRYNYALLGRLLPPGPIANLVDLPWMFLLEYGLRFVACLLVPLAVYRHIGRDPGLGLLAVCSIVGLGAFLTFRSSIHLYDYSFKIALFPSMALTAMLAGCVLSCRFGRPRPWNPLGWSIPADRFGRYRRAVAALVAGLIVAALPVGLYEAPVTAVRRFVEQVVQRRRLAPQQYAPIRDEHEAWRFLRHELPADAVVQTHPAGARIRLVQVVRRQFGVMDPSDADVQVFRPANIGAMRAAFRDVQEAARTASSRRAHELLRRWGITHVFCGRIERAHWQHLDKFRDGRYFRVVFDRPWAQVYELLAAPQRPQTRVIAATLPTIVDDPSNDGIESIE